MSRGGGRFTGENAAEYGRRGGKAAQRNLARRLVGHPRLPDILIPADRAQRLKAAETMRANGHYRRMGQRSGVVRRAKKETTDE